MNKKIERLINTLGVYLCKLSTLEDFIELIPDQVEFQKATDICWEILKRTKLISSIMIQRPEEFKEIWEKNDPEFDVMQKYPPSSCELADDVIKKIRQRKQK